MTDTPAMYRDEDLVYVDPETRSVIGKVEFGKNDKPKSKLYQAAPDTAAGKKEGKRSFMRKYYPWGTFKSMKKIYKLEGNVKDPEPNLTLDEVLPKALKDPYWN